MAAANVKWKDNEQLSADLKKYVEQRLQRNEILDYMQRDYDFYFWSIRTLDRRLNYFNIRYIDGNIPVANIREAVAKELEGPGALLGYRAMTQKIRQKYHLPVPRDLIHGVMFELDPEGLARRTPGAKKRKPRGHFVTMGPNWTYSLDGHDKLMGYQNSTFPLAIYGCIDTASRKLIWLKIWNTNSNPLVIGKWSLESLMETKLLPNHLRMDKGTETTVMSTMHSYLRSQPGDLEDPTDSIIFGPSPSNQVQLLLLLNLLHHYWNHKYCRCSSSKYIRTFRRGGVQRVIDKSVFIVRYKISFYSKQRQLFSLLKQQVCLPFCR